ncbi:MAG: hypothetical protein AB7G17_02535 [Phycisphaerales bacterium]
MEETRHTADARLLLAWARESPSVSDARSRPGHAQCHKKRERWAGSERAMCVARRGDAGGEQGYMNQEQTSQHARREERVLRSGRLAWRGAVHEGELKPGDVQDASTNGVRLAVRISETPAVGTVIKVQERGERYPTHFRVVHVRRGHNGAAEVGCERISSREYRAARHEAAQRRRAERPVARD